MATTFGGGNIAYNNVKPATRYPSMLLDDVLQRALGEWPQWGLTANTQPEIIAALPAGSSNRSYLLGTANTKYVLRITGAQSLYAFDRDTERRLQNQLAQHAIAPAVLYQNNAAGYRVSEFFPGETLASRPAITTVELAALVEIVLRYQRCDQCSDLKLPALDYAGQLQRYWEQARAHMRTEYRGSMAARYATELQRAQEFEANNRKRRVLCHHDLNPGNILRLAEPMAGAKPVFAILDWEFAARGIASMDFAALSVELALDLDEVAELAGIPAAELREAAAVYRFICELYLHALPQ